VVAAETGEVLERRADEHRVPETKDETRGKKRLPVLVRAAGQKNAHKVELSRDDPGNLRLFN